MILDVFSDLNDSDFPLEGSNLQARCAQLLLEFQLLLECGGLMLVLAPSAEQSAASKLLWHSEIHKRYGKSLINSLKILNGKNVTETLEILFETEQILQSKDRTTVYQPSWFSGTAWQQLKYSLKNCMKRSGNRNDCISLGTEHRKSIKTLGKMSFLC